MHTSALMPRGHNTEGLECLTRWAEGDQSKSQKRKRRQKQSRPWEALHLTLHLRKQCLIGNFAEQCYVYASERGLHYKQPPAIREVRFEVVCQSVGLLRQYPDAA